MRSMGIDRRRFLAILAAYGGALGLVQENAAATSREGFSESLYLAARKNAVRFEAVMLDEHGRDRLVVPMPARGHSFAIDTKRGRAVVFGRQPGFFAVAFDLSGKSPQLALQAATERHFFGHGVFSLDGKTMLATENSYEKGRGVLGVYDSSPGGNYRRIGEISTGGIGPHEVVLMPDGRTLCVANGGILTHPDYGKLALNADTMQPSLAYVDLHTGDLLDQVSLSPQLNRLSIRHLVIDASGAIWFGCQYTGATEDFVPLVGRHRRGSKPELFSGPADSLRGMKHYVGSLAANAAGTIIASSSPVGGKIIFWDAASGDYLREFAMFDGGGVAPAAGEGFLASSGQGEILRLSGSSKSESVLPAASHVAWDNHLRRV